MNSKRIWCQILSVVCLIVFCVGAIGCKNGRNAGCRYEIVAEYEPETSTLTATMKVDYVNSTDEEITALKFNLYPNAYREDAAYKPVSLAYVSSAYYAGKNYGSMEISSVTGAKSWEIGGEDQNILCVYPENSLFPGEQTSLEIAFCVRLAKVNHRTGVTEKTVNLGNFFPILCAYENGSFYECVYYSDGDPFCSDCANYEVTLTAPEEYVVAATGKTVSEKVDGNKKTYTMSATNVRDFAMVLSDCFEVATTKKGDVEVKYYYYNDDQPTAHLMLAEEALEYYSSTFGAYPYDTYTVAQTGFCYGGMEYPMLTMIGDSLGETDFVYTLVHETAHQWWCVAVGSNQVENAWQDEGLAEYSAVMFFESNAGYGFTREELIADALREYRAYYNVYNQVFGEADTRMTRSLNDYLSEYEYRCIAYDKSAVMFDMLRTSVGDKRFLAGLKRYYEDYRFKTASSAALIGCFEKSGVDIAGFFDSFLSGKAVI